MEITPEIKIKLEELAVAAGKVQAEVVAGTLKPGRRMTFTFDHATGTTVPVCAVGHALAKAGFKAPRAYVSNYDALDVFLDSRDWHWAEGWGGLTSALDRLTAGNDSSSEADQHECVPPRIESLISAIRALVA
jgi:hypothetical protein